MLLSEKLRSGYSTGAEIKSAYEAEPDTNAFTDNEKTKLSNIEENADVTDAANVNAAGATMNNDTDISGNSWVIDEDDMASDSNTKVPTQQSVKSYAMGVNDYLMTTGRIMNPLLHMPLKNGLYMLAGTGTVNFTRSTTATYVDRYGVLKTAAIDEARFEKEGLLIEGASTNKLLYSEQFDNAAWDKYNLSLSANAIIAPDGTTTADKLIENTLADAFHYISKVMTTNITTVSFSVYAKAGEHSSVKLLASNTTDNEIASAIFNLSDGTITEGTGSIKKLSNGWFRCSITGTPTVDSSRYYIELISSTNTIHYTGDGTSGLYIWGAQLEELPFASSYIPTTDAAVTRAKEVCYFTTEGNTPNPQLENLTILCDEDLIGIDSSNLQYSFTCAMSSGSLSHMASQDINNNYWWNSGDQYVVATDFESGGVSRRFGGVLNGNLSSIYVDGVYKSSASNTSNGELNLSTNRFYIGSSYSEAHQLFGHISNFRIYDVALSEQEMKIA